MQRRIFETLKVNVDTITVYGVSLKKKSRPVLTGLLHIYFFRKALRHIFQFPMMTLKERSRCISNMYPLLM